MHIRIAKIITVVIFVCCFVLLVNFITWNLEGMIGSMIATSICTVILMICMIIDVIKTSRERRKYRD